MFDDVIKYTDELLQGAESTQDFLNKLYGDRRRLQNRIIKARLLVKEIQLETNYVATIKQKLTKSIKATAKVMLYNKMLEAIRENYEFDAPPYKAALLLAVYDDDTYIIRTSGSGFSSTVKVDINLDRTAGRLNMWAAAVKATRKELGVKVFNKNTSEAKRQKAALLASRAWAGIFAKRSGVQSTFSKTIRMRLSYASKPAPFWQLLDKGEVQLASDRGGYATPKKKATNFVDSAETSINNYIKTLLSKEQEKAKNISQDSVDFIEAAQLALDDVSNMIYQIRLNKNFMNRVRTAYNQKLKNATDVLDKAENSLKKTKDYRAGSLERAMENIQRGTPGSIIVDVEEGQIFIHDGRHTLEAYKRLGIKNPPFVLRSDDGSL